MERSFLLNTLSESFKVHRIVGLLGPRQCGKTHLARQYNDRFEQVPRQNYFDLENPNDYERLRNPYQSLRSLTGLVIIDEIQRIPELFPILRVLHDDDTDRRFLILGSASKALIQQSSETLTGRICYKEITPFSFFETHEWHSLWFRGGFPRSYLAETDQQSLAWREAYIQTLLEQDVPNLGFRIPAMQLRRFWMLLAHCHGQIFNGHDIARHLDLSSQSIRRYLDLLHDMLMVRILPPWHENIAKRQVKSPKTYIRDSGLFHTLIQTGTRESFELSMKKGASFEGFAIEEIIRLLSIKPEEAFFWRTQAGAELDLLIVSNNKKIGFEIKLTDRPTITKSMHTALHDLQLEHLYVVHPGDVTWPLADNVTSIALSDLQNIGRTAGGEIWPHLVLKSPLTSLDRIGRLIPDPDTEGF